MRNISADDRAEIKKKKAAKGAAGTLAIYCCYGAGTHKDNTSHSRIHLADPPNDVWYRPYDRKDGIEAAMNQYLEWEIDLVAQVKRALPAV